MAKPRTLYDKIWDDHLAHEAEDGTCLLYIDRHLVHEVTSPQAFEGLRMTGRKVRHPEKTLAVVDHNVPTTDRSKGIAEEESRIQVETLARNAAEFGVKYFNELDRRQGIVHVVGPEQGFTLPGTTIVCGDSHTSTHGAFGALAHGIGTSEVEHVLATQTLIQKKAKNMLVQVDGKLPKHSTAKDIILAVPISPMTARMMSLAVEPFGSLPSTVTSMFLAFFWISVWVARTCSTSDVPMPCASAPKAPWVEVWLSPQTMVVPGSVKPCSGPTTWTMPWRLSSSLKYLTPNSAALLGQRLDLDAAFFLGDALGAVGGGHVVVDDRQRLLRVAYLAAGHAQALEGLRARHFVDEVAVDVEKAGAILGLMGQMVVPDLVIERARLGHGMIAFGSGWILRRI